MTIGEILRNLRTKREMSAREIAEGIGVTTDLIYRWEKGEIYPSLLNAISLADFFGCSLDNLVGRVKWDKKADNRG